MSDFRDATFIPSQPPHQAILDYSNTQSAAQAADLNAQAQSMQSVIKAKVVILPSDFHVDNFKQFAYDLGMQWHVSGPRLLIVVDMKDHKVEMLAGKQLAASGLTGSVISGEIVPHHFVPNMKGGDLHGAIAQSLAAAYDKVSQSRSQQSVPSTAVPSTGYNAPAPVPENHISSSVGLLIGIAVIVAACAGLYGLSVRQRKEDNKKLAKQFEERVSPLYEKADQIGSASEFLANQGQSEIKQRIATFFNRMTAFEKAVTEVRMFEKQGKIWDVRDGYLKLLKMLGLMLPEAEKLRTDLNAVTGGVETYKTDETPLLDDTKRGAQEDAGAVVKIPERFQQPANYYRPQWTYEQAYYQPVDSGMSGLATMLMMMNQMEMLDYARRHGSGAYYDTQSTPWGGSFHRHDNNNSDWGSSSSSSSSDWGSSSSDSGFVEGGGSWDSGGGSFDSGGGFDSGGSSGGDW